MHQKYQKMNNCQNSGLAVIKTFLCEAKKRRVLKIFVLIIFLSCFPNLGITQTDESIVSKESFHNTIQYLATTYLDQILVETTQAENDLSRMELSLNSVIHEMLLENQKTLKQTAFNLHHEMPMTFTHEIQNLYNEVLGMQKRLEIQFSQ